MSAFDQSGTMFRCASRLVASIDRYSKISRDEADMTTRAANVRYWGYDSQLANELHEIVQMLEEDK